MTDVSIIIPVYNRCDLLRHTLASCLIQTVHDHEIIVVDDGSEENVAETVETTCRTFGRASSIRYIRQPHLGGTAARNRGLKESVGQFIQFLDSDDLLHPNKIEIQRDILLSRPEIDMVFSLDEYFHERPGDMQVLWNVPDPGFYLDRFLWDDPVWNTGSPLWRRKALDRIGPWNERLLCWQDWEFHVRVLCRGIQYAHVPRVLQYVRDHDQVRSTNQCPSLERERSKIEAAMAVARELGRASLWTAQRGDALATFLIQIAVNLSRAGAAQPIQCALNKALEYAGSLKLRLSASLIMTVVVLSLKFRRNPGPPIAVAYRVAHHFRYIPRHKRRWKAVTSDRSDCPSALLQALEGPYSSLEKRERIYDVLG